MLATFIVGTLAGTFATAAFLYMQEAKDNYAIAIMIARPGIEGKER